MKKLNFWLIPMVGLAGLMAFTNPSDQAYQEYATENLSIYLKEQACNQVTKELGDFLGSPCKSLVDTAQPQIKELIAQKTTRKNFVLFSIYETQLNLNNALPGYEFQTLGLFADFHLYQSEKI